MIQELLLAHFFKKIQLNDLEMQLLAFALLERENSFLGLMQKKEFFWASSLKDFILSKEKSALEYQFLRDLEDGIFFTYPGHKLYPRQFLRIPDPPNLLSFIGSPIWMAGSGLGVVGSREPGQESLDWLESCLKDSMRSLAVPIISGAARGIDQKAHATALRMGVPTVALIPSGLRQIYPSEFSYWSKEITEAGGAILTEYSSQAPMRKHHFQARNRLIAGLSLAVLLVEARKKSGSMVTARQAIEQGKPVLVMPTHPMDPRGAGGLHLLSEGAQPILQAEDLLVAVEAEMYQDQQLVSFDMKAH